MERETAIPEGCLWVDDESGLPRFVMGVDFGKGESTSAYAWLDDNGELVTQSVKVPPDNTSLVVLDERQHGKVLC